MHKKLKEVKPKDITNEELRSIVNNIRKFFKEEEDKVEINQEAIRIQYLFRGCMVKI